MCQNKGGGGVVVIITDGGVYCIYRHCNVRGNISSSSENKGNILKIVILGNHTFLYCYMQLECAKHASLPGVLSMVVI